MSFNKGNLVRRKDGIGDIMRVLVSNLECDDVYCAVGNDDDTHFSQDELELVVESVNELDSHFPKVNAAEQTVAIVNFEGAIKREVRAIREALKLVDSISSFTVAVRASGRVNENEVDIEYEVGGNKYNDEVKGSTMKECLAEFLRRNGWDAANAPKAITYGEIPF